MTARIDSGSGLSAAQKADIIYAQARDQMRESLWRAALSDSSDDNDSHASARIGGIGGMDAISSLSALLAALGIEDKAAPPLPVDARPAAPGPGPACVAPASTPSQNGTSGTPPTTAASGPVETGQIGGLGPNASYRASLDAAGARTGLPPAALAAIIDAEAAKGRDGSWNPYSRNSRSSAAGLGQFLAGTWTGMAQQPGNWLHDRAQAQGWLDSKGHVRGDSRAALLALRYDATASIETTADYARSNLNHMRRGGLDIGADAQSIASAAYLGHHLGPADAARFQQGGLSAHRASQLLTAQIGSGAAAKRISEAGDATTAHRRWLTSYISNKVQSGRYTPAEAA